MTTGAVGGSAAGRKKRRHRYRRRETKNAGFMSKKYGKIRKNTEKYGKVRKKILAELVKFNRRDIL